MYLSDEQMSAVSGARVSQWEPITLPEGKQPLPEWLKDAHVDWMHGAMNAPAVKLKVIGNVLNWDDKSWAKEGAKTYIARSGDGRAAVLYHDGAATRMAAWRVFQGDKPVTYQWCVPDWRNSGESWEAAAQRAGEEHLEKYRHFHSLYPSDKPVPDWVVVKSLDVTTKQSGFGGDGYFLTMTDGSERILRGPWHGGAPVGYVEVTAWDMTEVVAKWNSDRQWHRRGGYAGLYIAEDLFLRIIARFCPHVGMARVQHSYGPRLEPFCLEWGRAKSEIYELERSKAKRKEPAGEFWRVYWDGHERYCGQLRIPTHGFEAGVMDLPTEADYELAKRRPW
ncbi:hypothetical protein G3N58_17805 [Paraburkholderia sp. Ac-20342]|uniref:hypothetical protein n=1 Tax=Paraburkholderia sp. Ac-20342 TaxID=2703889 RepID=UPI00197F97D0|nr:hypothetical protein [Paraburkholderia sp. Ac-20342]MBN3848664.1 hypothetical protein [Paraburkholderia sp. Ac-20342]